MGSPGLGTYEVPAGAALVLGITSDKTLWNSPCVFLHPATLIHVHFLSRKPQTFQIHRGWPPAAPNPSPAHGDSPSHLALPVSCSQNYKSVIRGCSHLGPI